MADEARRFCGFDGKRVGDCIHTRPLRPGEPSGMPPGPQHIPSYYSCCGQRFGLWGGCQHNAHKPDCPNRGTTPTEYAPAPIAPPESVAGEGADEKQRSAHEWLEDALGRSQVTHIHSSVREALKVMNAPPDPAPESKQAAGEMPKLPSASGAYMDDSQVCVDRQEFADYVDATKAIITALRASLASKDKETAELKECLEVVAEGVDAKWDGHTHINIPFSVLCRWNESRNFAQTEIAELRASSVGVRDAWISVDRELPGLMLDVRVLDREGDVCRAHLEMETPQQWFWYSRHSCQVVHNITHWQPLPSPPISTEPSKEAA